jgi:CRISPR-associated protein Cas5h
MRWRFLMDCLVFRVKSGYAKFRKPYTTTSALTFLCIHPPAIKGLIGAIVGIDRGDLYESTKDMRIGIQVLSPIHKDMQTIKLVSMKNENDLFSFPVNAEFLRNPEYRIFVSWRPEKLDELEDHLKNQKPVFTPYLGVSEHVAKIIFETRCESIRTQTRNNVDSIIPINCFDLDHCDLKIFTDNIPVSNNEKREYTKYEKIMFGFKNDRPCALKGNATGELHEVVGQNVFFFQ